MIGGRLLHYHILGRLGRGGMGEVYLARDEKLGREVALKVLSADFVSDPDRRRRLEREARALAGLSHPNVVTVYAIEEDDDVLFITMERVDGISLRQRIPSDGLPPRELLSLAIPLASGLAAAHRSGVTHRDLKPENVMVTRDGNVKVLDFGLAKRDDGRGGTDAVDSQSPTRPATDDTTVDHATREGRVLGTLAYMSPEQAEGKRLDARSDIFSFGTVLYEMATGMNPFHGDTTASRVASILRDEPRSLADVRSALPRQLGRIVERCLAKRPEERFQSAADVEAALRDLEEEVTHSHSGTSADIEPVPPARATARAAAVTAIFLVASAVILGGVWLVDDRVGLPAWALPAAIVLLGVGLPIVLTTAVVQSRPRDPRGGGGRSLFTWRRALSGGVGAFGALALTVGAMLWMRASGVGPGATLVSAGVLDADARVLIAEIENATDDPMLGAVIAEALAIDLAQSSIVHVVPPGRVRYLLARMRRDPATPLTPETAREVALRDGIPAVLSGLVSPAGSGFVLSLRLSDPTDDEVLLAERESARSEDDVIVALDRLSRRVREGIGESLRSIRQDARLEDVTTRSLASLRAYTQAVQLAEDGEDDEALVLLDEAIAADTTFAMAYRKKGVILSNRGSDHAGGALEAAFRHRDRLTQRERLLTEASCYTFRDDVDRAILTYERLIELNPRDNWALNNCALLLAEHGDAERAMTYFERAAAEQPTALNVGNLAWWQMSQGETALAESTMVRYSRATGHEWHWWLTMGLALRNEDFASVESIAREHRREAREDAMDDADWTLWASLVVRGKLEEAFRHVETVLDRYERGDEKEAMLDLLLDKAIVQVMTLGDVDGASATLERALRECTPAELPASERHYAKRVAVRGLLGDVDQARALLAARSSLPDSLRDSRDLDDVLPSWVAFFDGRYEDAVPAFRRAVVEQGRTVVWPLAWLGLTYDAMAMPDSAIAIYERYLRAPASRRLFTDHFWRGLILQRLVELHEDRGDLDAAAAWRRRLADQWAEADAPFRAGFPGRLTRVERGGD